jgi:hypothetical protein
VERVGSFGVQRAGERWAVVWGSEVLATTARKGDALKLAAGAEATLGAPPNPSRYAIAPNEGRSFQADSETLGTSNIGLRASNAPLRAQE